MVATLYEREDRTDDAMQARERWLGYNAGEQPMRLQVAAWHAEAGRHAEAAKSFAGANDVDPFHSGLHVEWARSLEALGDVEGALREVRVALLVPADVDGDPRGAPDAEDRSELLAWKAELLVAAGRPEEARAAAEEALQLAADSERAQAVLDAL